MQVKAFSWPPMRGDHVREVAGRIFRRALEHQMFEKMRQPRLARRLVGGADFVPDHVGDDRRAVVGNDDEFQTVRQREVGDIGGRLVGGEHGRSESRREQRAAAMQSGLHCHVIQTLRVTKPMRPTRRISAARTSLRPERQRIVAALDAA